MDPPALTPRRQDGRLPDGSKSLIADLSSALDWLETPLSGAARADLPAWTYWHARLMVFAWAFVMPVGAFAARFFKVTPGQDWPRVLDRKGWWRTHFWLQNLGVAAMTLGLALALGQGPMAGGAALAHHLFGWTLVVLGWLQFASGWLRGDKGGPTAPRLRGDHYDMTPRRVAFEYVHKSLGWVALALVIPTIALGLALADAPRWMALAPRPLDRRLIAAFTRWQRAGRCVDTYQAIWGPDPAHPGNRRRPIGLGVGASEPRGRDRV